MPTQDNIKTFFKGKQNRDNDPRVIPDGEYIRLVNGRIARSEGDGVGSLENTLGNEQITSFVDANAVVLGSVRDIAENKIYYFIKGSEEDAVYEFDEATQTTVALLRDDRGILNFNVDNLITSARILGISDTGDAEETIPSNIRSQKLLIWTDNLNPPRKVNVNRIRARLGQRLNGFTESEISLEKAPPLFAPQAEELYLNVDTENATEAVIDAILSGEGAGQTLARRRELAQLTIESLEREENLKDKFPRFAYRYRYEDNEYSAFSPFTEAVFRPDVFGYDEATGTVTGMENQVRAIDISFNTGPSDVVEIDLLYKDAGNNTVYVVETYNKADRGWSDNVDLSHLNNEEIPVRFFSQKLYRALPDSQLLRVFDNVPIRAKAMEIVDNRVMFGNYVDQYDLLDVRKVYDNNGNLTQTIEEEIVVDLNARISKPEEIGQDGDAIQQGVGERTLKSDRDYELGIVYLDNLGRQTPVLTSQNNSVRIPANRANRINRVSVEVNSKAPEFATHYRFFIKDTRSAAHHNIIPLETQIQPDDDNFRWYRLAETDQEKISVGDYLVLKINEGTFSYSEDQERVVVRVEELGIRGRNFLETDEPRVGIVTDESTGEVLDEGEIYTAQRPGLWMRTSNIREIPVDGEEPARGSESNSRSNNARNANFQPIKGIPARASSPVKRTWQDLTYYYRGSTVGANNDLDEGAITFSGTYNPGFDEDGDAASGHNPSLTPNTASLGPNDHGAGPMRVQVEILDNNEWQFSWWIAESSAEPVVRRWNHTPTANTIPETAPDSPAAVPLVNGVSVAFNLNADQYTVGDRWTVVFRNQDNFMWRPWPTSGTRRDHDPNGTSRTGIGARRSHIMLYGPGVLENGINGNSMLQFGIEDGLERRLDGDPIAFPFDRNQYFTNNVFYPNFEEFLFEEGLWTSGGNERLSGTDRDGNNIGIHQLGFYRGMPDTPENDADLAAIVAQMAGAGAITGLSSGLMATPAFLQALSFINPFFALGGAAIGALINAVARGKSTENYWRLRSGAPGDLVNLNTSEALPLYCFVQSGTFNDGGNNKKAERRQRGRFSFFQGNGAAQDEINTLNLAFETIPEESNLDVYYEIGDTFTCLNGVHFGNELSNAQRITYLDRNGNETQSAFTTLPDGTIIDHTETATVSPITINLDYYNCFAWNNGIEIKSIRDEIVTPALDPGAKASTVTQNYERSDNFANIIYSERFDQQAGINGLNEFSSTSAALGSNIKEMDEADSSIQHMFSRDTNLVVFQEDKVNQVLVNKDQLLNADGTSNITSSQIVLGQTVPFAGEYGISQNPESFAVYGTRLYFADKNRGVICRLGQSGIEEISNFGMRDYFREQLRANPLAIGSYDDYHDQYIVSMRGNLVDPGGDRSMLPLRLSKQAFLSRTDACRFPENDLQYTQVYEFYRQNEPLGFQIGDLIYYDQARTRVFNGDNDWFVWFQEENEIQATGQSGTTVAGDVVNQEFLAPNLRNVPVNGQTVRVVNNTNANVFNATVVRATQVTGGVQVLVQYSTVVGSGAAVTLADTTPGDHDLNFNFKFVINIDNFGFVRAKEDCAGITPPNHDAVRVSISSYSSPQEACAKGLVSRVIYHNGNDATPDVGDSIFDTPYGSDEFIEGAYFQGRTQKRGWYQMFDGAMLEDFVINIIQGRVVRKISCAELNAGRRRLLTSEFPVQRRTDEIEERLATRVCSILPTEENFHNGAGLAPVLGDTIFTDNFTNTPLPAGYYSIENEQYVRVNNDGVVTFIGTCSVKVTVEDPVQARILSNQFQTTNSWTWLGVGNTDANLPQVSAVEADLSGNGELTFNGNITRLGDFAEVNYSWYYLATNDSVPTERDLINDGAQILGRTTTRTRIGAVDEVVQDGFPGFTNIYHIFVVEVDNVFITTPVLNTRTLRSTTPPLTLAVDQPAPEVGDTVTFTSTIILESTTDTYTMNLQRDENTVLTQSNTEGTTVDNGNGTFTTTHTFTISNWQTTNDGGYRTQAVLTGSTVISPTVRVDHIEVARLTSFLATDPNFEFDGTRNDHSHDVIVQGTPGATYEITGPGTFSPSTGTIGMNRQNTHTWTAPENIDGTTGDQPARTLTATATATGPFDRLREAGMVTVDINQSAGVPIDAGESGFNPSTYLVTTQEQVATQSNPVYTGSFEPPLGTRTSSFTQTQQGTATTTYTDLVRQRQQNCDQVIRAATGGASQAACSDGTAFGSFRVTESNIRTSRSPDVTDADRTRFVTVTGTATTDTGFGNPTEAASGLGDVNGDGDTLDILQKVDQVYTASAPGEPNIGSHTVEGTVDNGGISVMTNVSPQVTLNFTGPTNQDRQNTLAANGFRANRNGDTASGAVGNSWSFDVSYTPSPGFRWTDNQGTEQRDYAGTGMFINAANTDVDPGFAFDNVEEQAPSGSISVSVSFVAPGGGLPNGACRYTISAGGDATTYYSSLGSQVAVGTTANQFGGTTVDVPLGDTSGDRFWHPAIASGSLGREVIGGTGIRVSAGSIGDTICSPGTSFTV